MPIRPIRPILTLLAVSASASLVACGDDKKSDAEKPADRATALREVGETRSGLQAALLAYRKGDRATAEDEVAEAYVSHYEEVEHALEERDEALNEKLEETISGDLRTLVSSPSSTTTEVERAFKAVLADLDKAEAALR